jgi:hypothetical protein
MGRTFNLVMGMLAIFWGVSTLVSGPDVSAHSSSRGWGQPPMWIEPNPYQQAFGAFLLVWGIVFIYLGLRRQKQPSAPS